tara:strand:- start:758 stop:904 length:147 start_codon:yes stop_codon:yes gene_type:complete
MPKSTFKFKPVTMKKITSPLSKLESLNKATKMKPYTLAKKPRGFGKYK